MAYASEGVDWNPAQSEDVNTLSIYQSEVFEDERIKTVIVTNDGVEIMEIHRAGLSESDVLNDLQGRNYFQHLKGSWSIVFEGCPYVFQRDTFDAAITIAKEYIYNRDSQSNFMDLFD